MKFFLEKQNDVPKDKGPLATCVSPFFFLGGGVLVNRVQVRNFVGISGPNVMISAYKV